MSPSYSSNDTSTSRYARRSTVGGSGDPESEAILEVDGAEVPGGANLSLVAHLSEDGEPTLTPFANDVSEVAAGDAGGEPVFTDLTNPNEDGADLPAGTVEADVVLAGTEDVVLGPADLDLAEGTATIVYAIGSAEDGTLDLVVQTIDGLHSPPSGVPSGTGGQAATGVAAAGGRRAGARGDPGRRQRRRRLAGAGCFGGGHRRGGGADRAADERGNQVGITPATGEFDVPPSVDQVGWYEYGPGLEAEAGSIVIAGHVDSADQGEGAFYALGELAPGDPVEAADEAGEVRRFEVVAREVYDKEEIPLARYFARDGELRLTLITCGGEFDPAAGRYQDNVVVTAVPVP